MIDQPTSASVSASSLRMIGISGATPNHAKKQTRNDSHAMWNARIGGLVRSNGVIRVARLSVIIVFMRFSLASPTTSRPYDDRRQPSRRRSEQYRAGSGIERGVVAGA